MKLLILIALSIVTLGLVTPVAHADVLDTDTVLAKYNQSFSNSRQSVERQVSKGKSAREISEGLIDTFITNNHRIKVNLEMIGDGTSKNVDARLVIYLNSEHGGIILGLNKILLPTGKISYKTLVKNEGENVVTLTKMYIPIDIYSPGVLAARLALLTKAINNGRLVRN